MRSLGIIMADETGRQDQNPSTAFGALFRRHIDRMRLTPYAFAQLWSNRPGAQPQLSAVLRGAKPPPEEHIAQWMRLLRLTPEEQVEFIAAAAESRAWQYQRAVPVLEKTREELIAARHLIDDMRDEMGRLLNRIQQMESFIRANGLEPPALP